MKISTKMLEARINAEKDSSHYRFRIETEEDCVLEWAFYCRLEPGTYSVAGEELYKYYKVWVDRHSNFPLADEERFFGILTGRIGVQTEDATLDTLYLLNKDLAGVIVPSLHKHKAYMQLDPKRLKKENRRSVDYDYLHKLSAHDSLWLSKFTDEYYNDHFYDDGQDFITDIRERRVISYNRRARSRDALIGYSQGPTTYSYDDEITPDYNLGPEDALVDYIDTTGE